MIIATVSESDLATIVESYNEVTERLKQSHEILGREVRRLRDELLEKRKELARRERLAALGEMAAGVAHEIRNPLGAIGLYASLLEKDLKNRPQQRDIAQRISVGVRNLESIVGDILAFAGESRPHRRGIRLGNIIESVLAQTAPQASAVQVKIDVDRRMNDIEVYCDPIQMERAVMNLVFNAIDACDQGGSVWIRLRLGGDDHSLVRILVEDDGPGIAPEIAHRIFNPFFTTKDTGTGLGLAIVHRIVEAHGGHIRVGCRAGGGASLELSLPARPKDAQVEQAAGDD
ncbi:MAG: sensor histidine kinase [Planctomycetes bacterium]|nr:sensor histidine kinase [Planctomycetota bacterium]